MKLKLFTMKFSDEVDGFDETELQKFIEDKEVIDYKEYFFTHEKSHYVTIILSYRETYDNG